MGDGRVHRCPHWLLGRGAGREAAHQFRSLQFTLPSPSLTAWQTLIAVFDQILAALVLYVFCWHSPRFPLPMCSSHFYLPRSSVFTVRCQEGWGFEGMFML